MPLNPTTPYNDVPKWAIAIFAILLLFPLIELPRPSLITTPPWKVELVVSLFLLVSLLWSRRHLTFAEFPGPAKPVLVLLGCFTAWSGISIIWASNSGSVIHHTLVWAGYLVFFGLAVSLLFYSKRIATVVTFAVTITSALAILCILDYLTLVDFAASEGTLRIRWAKYAELLVTILPFLWAITCCLRGRDKAILLLVASAGWIAAMLSLSRSALISGTIGFVILFGSVIALSSSRHRRATVKLAAIWIVLTVGFQLGTAYFTSVPATSQYISGTADPTRSTSTMRIFTWSVTGLMIKRSSMIGVGADNFGSAFIDGRRAYTAAFPDDPNNAIGEDYLFERAHNEYLQIVAELGIPGFLVLFGAFTYLGLGLARYARAMHGRVSPALLGAVAGMSAFAVSSLFTSFSFRAFQNGIAFFAMAAVATFLASRRANRISSQHAFVLPLAIAATLALLIFSALIGSSQIFSTIAERATTPEETRSSFQRALSVYPENGGTQLSLASVEARVGNYQAASDLMRSAIENGVSASIAYARLSAYEEKAGNIAASLSALEDGLVVFPRSLYLRAYLVLLLERTGDASRAEKEVRIARELDLKQANGWYALIKLGSKDAYQLSRNDPNIAGPADLLPQNAIYEYLNEDMSP